jgi:hypothetical protein
MSMRVTPQDLQAAANALSGVHRDTGIEGVRTAGSLGAEAAGNAAVARSLQEVCARIEWGAAAFRAIVRTTEVALCKCADDYSLADAGGGRVFERITQVVDRATP